MKSGVSLVSLIITIIVMIILASISIFSSMGTIDESQNLKAEAEYREVCNYITEISSKYSAGLITLDLSGDKLAEEEIASFQIAGDDIINGELDKIDGFNDRAPKYGYYYVKGADLENQVVPKFTSNTSYKEFSVPKKVENDYIINYYYGVVVAKISPTKTLISGTIK